MGEIRSALDIAMEKTAHIEGDKDSADNRELKNAGKKAAGDFMGTGELSIIEKVLSGKSFEQMKQVSHGAISIILASLRLPGTEADLVKVSRAGTALDKILPDTGIIPLFSHVEQIFKQYLDERANLEKTLEQQFIPRLKAKQQEMAKRYGQSVPLELNQDQDYLAALSKNKRLLEQKYETVITEVRARVREAAGMEA